MRVVLFVVNYHADEHLGRLVDSLSAAVAVAGQVDLDIHVLDNSCRSGAEVEQLSTDLRSRGLPLKVHSSGRNEGYFGVLPLAQSLATDAADVIIYCNPDLLFEPSFFVELAAVRSAAGLLAPAVIAAGGVDLNPVSPTRLPARKLEFLRYVYSSLLSYRAYMLAGRLKEILFRRSQGGGSFETHDTYIAHGSVFVFSDVAFFRSLPSYPCFLFGEELFIAEEARLRGVRTAYAPSLRVRNVRHASISLLPRGELREYARESVSHILERYYDRAADSPP